MSVRFRPPAPPSRNTGQSARQSDDRVQPAAGAVLQQDLATRIADAPGYVGTLACEFFAAADGPVFNEMAPRVHNSGHWTIEGARTSQFENHIRAVCGLPLGGTDTVYPRVEMRNLIGAQADRWLDILSDPTAHLHLYGKAETKPGRKMGHLTATAATSDEARSLVLAAREALGNGMTGATHE